MSLDFGVPNHKHLNKSLLSLKKTPILTHLSIFHFISKKNIFPLLSKSNISVISFVHNYIYIEFCFVNLESFQDDDFSAILVETDIFN